MLDTASTSLIWKEISDATRTPGHELQLNWQDLFSALINYLIWNLNDAELPASSREQRLWFKQFTLFFFCDTETQYSKFVLCVRSCYIPELFSQWNIFKLKHVYWLLTLFHIPPQKQKTEQSSFNNLHQSSWDNFRSLFPVITAVSLGHLWGSFHWNINKH